MQSTLRQYRDQLQMTPWLSVFGYGILIFIYGTMLSFILPNAWQRPFERFLLVAPLVLLAAKDLAGFPLAIARWNAASARGDSWLKRMVASQPPEFRGYLRVERAMWGAFFSWMLRRPQPALPTGQPLGYLDRGSYGTVICCAMVSLCVEVPIDALIASVLAKTPEQARLFHIVFGCAVVYSFVWVLGDRWQVMGRRHHVLTATSLELDIGIRGFGSIPLDAIAGVERLMESRADWCKRHGHALHATRKLTPFDAPNVVMLLHPGSDVCLQLFQVKRGGDGPIFLYVDRPEQLSGLARPSLP